MKLITAILLCLSLATLPVGGVIVVNSFLSAAAVSTSYANTGGTGDRTGIITVTDGVSYGSGNGTKLINGGSGNDCWWLGSTSTANVQFDFGSAKVINEITWKQSGADPHGTWSFQGSADASSWADLGSTFTLGSSGTQTITAPSGNTTSYRYYRIHGVSGSLSSGPWLYEIEFKISS